MITSARGYSFHIPKKLNIPAAISPGFASGSIIRQKTVKCEQPSIRPASASSWGSVLKNPVRMNIVNESEYAT